MLQQAIRIIITGKEAYFIFVQKKKIVILWYKIMGRL